MNRFQADDLQDLLATEAAGAAGLIENLITEFGSKLDSHLREIEYAQMELNFQDLRRFTHTLKSSTRVLGLRAASEICKNMEGLARESVYNPRDLKDLRAEIIPALLELRAFESSRTKS